MLLYMWHSIFSMCEKNKTCMIFKLLRNTFLLNLAYFGKTHESIKPLILSANNWNQIFNHRQSNKGQQLGKNE